MPEFMSLLVSLFIPLHQTVRFSFLSSAPSDSFKNLTVFSLLEICKVRHLSGDYNVSMHIFKQMLKYTVCPSEA